MCIQESTFILLKKKKKTASYRLISDACVCQVKEARGGVTASPTGWHYSLVYGSGFAAVIV